MKKLLYFIAFMLVVTAINAQELKINDIHAINSALAAQSRLFCKYVVAVGSSSGQKGAANDVQKNDIIRNRVPRLFWNYNERYMLTTNGKNGSVIKKRSMSQYFNNLKAQSKCGPATSRSYELRFIGVIPQAGGKNPDLYVMGTTCDGCIVYGGKVLIDQIYYVINWTQEGAIVKEEHDMKELEVNVLAKPNGKFQVLLGDVKKANRIK